MPLKLVRKEGGWEFDSVTSLVFVIIASTYCFTFLMESVVAAFTKTAINDSGMKEIVLMVLSFYYGRKSGANGNGGEHAEPKPDEAAPVVIQ